ncbi:MAG: hypothetical protein IKP10_03920 [Clostridia bacterium]|nr:hypothetical protein [Clostridia bacterium]
MNATVILIEAAAFAALFTAIVLLSYRGGGKYGAGAIHNYPPDIREEYFRTHERLEVSCRSKKVLLTKGLGLLLFTAVLLGCALLAGAADFWQGFWLTFGLMAWIGVYDTFFLDWVLFANLPMFRLEGTEHMDGAYHQKWFHVKGMLFPGTVFALIPALLVGLLTAVIR